MTLNDIERVGGERYKVPTVKESDNSMVLEQERKD